MEANNPTDLLSWLSRRKFLSLTHRECDWLIELEHDALTAEVLFVGAAIRAR